MYSRNAMTKTQRELAESAFRLAMFLAMQAQRRYGAILEHQEYIDAAIDGLITATRVYDKGKGRFPSYAGIKIKWEILRAVKAKIERRNKAAICSLDTESEQGGTLMDTIAERETDTTLALAVRDALRRVSPRSRKILEMRMDGHTLEEIGESMGTTKEWARQSLRKAEREMRKFFSREDLIA